tara:strand:+ start:2075 stop:2419 length:345 start_codon:yes stop_codon:yes gene_type:complete
MFKVKIENLKVKTKIGISSKERKKDQLLLLTLEFDYNLPKKVNVNDIKYLKNYSTITKFLKKIVKYSNHKTLESLIIECEKKLKKEFNLKNISLTINKIDIAKKYGCDSISVSK